MASAIRPTALAGVGGLVLALVAAGVPAAAGMTAGASTAPALSATAAASDSAALSAARSMHEPYLRAGSRGEAVAAWQRALNRWLRTEGRARLATDGIFGPRTDAATRALQRASRIAVDGIVGPATRSALAGALGGGGSKPFEGTVGISTSLPSGEPLGFRGVRFGVHEEFDRVVLDLPGDGVPGWHVEYVDRPVREQGSGRVVPMAGDAWLRIGARGVGYPADTGVPYPRLERVPTRGGGVVEDLYVGTLFEGSQDVVVGVASPEEYRVFPLGDPPRLVVDIAHPSEG